VAGGIVGTTSAEALAMVAAAVLAVVVFASKDTLSRLAGTLLLAVAMLAALAAFLSPLVRLSA